MNKPERIRTVRVAMRQSEFSRFRNLAKSKNYTISDYIAKVLIDNLEKERPLFGRLKHNDN